MITVLSRHRSAIVFSTLTVMSIIVGLACIFIGSVDIPFDEVVNSLIGKGTQKPTWDYIIHESRIPLTITAALAGAALAISGLLMQTTFQNPLAGPSILGVSTGASMGVAILTLGAGGLLQGIFGNHIGEYVTNIVGALLGAGIIISILDQVLSRSGREEQATMTTLAGLVVVLMMVAQKIADLFDLIKHLFDF